ncbi:hypothetical protein H5410_019317 [Solanum commersonii]|uniref:Uncharacterized protein n=1 Tax=Solanum commersonii TaxID=4109 RepID=A0A9J5Z998_SOLCO|nr:hypothetical protein H5410_019317 [Solanum commersonii]
MVTTAKTAHFQGKMNPGAGKLSILPIFVCYYPHLSYVANWSPRPKRPILKVKQSPEQLVTTAKTAHFQGQTIPETSKPPILPIFMCYSPRDLLVTQNSKVIFAKNLDRSSLRP